MRGRVGLSGHIIESGPSAVVPLPAYQREDIESNARFRWNCWARQTGKSFTKSLRRILRGLQRHRTQIFLSAGERQCRELMDKARQHCQAMSIATQYHDDEWFRDLSIRQMTIVLPGKVRIIGLPANPMTARGYTGDVFLDEFAMHADAQAIWAAMFPALLRGGGELDVASTPRGKGNLFYQLRDNELFSSSTVTLPEAIAMGLDVDAEEMRRGMADEALYRQEFLCEFLDEATAYLTLDHLSACADAELPLYDEVGALSSETREMFAGVDVGRMHDLTVVWVVAREGHELVTVAVFEMAMAPFRKQFALLEALLSVRNVRRCCIDSGGLGMQLGEQAVERFGVHRVEAMTLTAAVKSQLAGGLRIALENRRLLIPDDERIHNDFHSVERTLTASGHVRLAASRHEGSHADRFWAAALAVHAAQDGAGPVEFAPARALQFSRAGAW